MTKNALREDLNTLNDLVRISECLIYLWKDGRKNFDTMTTVYEYGLLEDPTSGFQVVYSSRQTNAAGGVRKLYYSNGGTHHPVAMQILTDHLRKVQNHHSGLSVFDSAAFTLYVDGTHATRSTRNRLKLN